jgi:hypothetical protein
MKWSFIRLCKFFLFHEVKFYKTFPSFFCFEKWSFIRLCKVFFGIVKWSFIRLCKFFFRFLKWSFIRLCKIFVPYLGRSHIPKPRLIDLQPSPSYSTQSLPFVHPTPMVLLYGFQLLNFWELALNFILNFYYTNSSQKLGLII